MQFYTSDNALLRLWKKKIIATSTNRNHLKRQLLAICDDTTLSIAKRLQQLRTRRNLLLSDNHGQGWFWTSPFSSMWNWLSYILPSTWHYYHFGSRLRQSLVEEVKLSSVLINPLEIQPIPNSLLSDDDYEEAIFYEPIKAIASIKQSILNLATNNPSSIVLASLLMRINALKYRLEATFYYQWLDQLYQGYPAETFNYFYYHYKINNCEIPEPQDFVEQYLMARQLIKTFVTSHTTIYPRLHSILHLLILLSGNDYLGIDDNYITELFNSSNLDDVINQLDISYEKMYCGLRLQLDKKLGQIELNNRKGKQLLTAQCKEPTPLTVLTDIFNTLHSVKNPLLIHVARQCCEQLFLDYNENREEHLWHPGRLGYDTIKLITSKLLDTWCLCHHSLEQTVAINRFDEQNTLLNPMMHMPIIPEIMKRAEKYALQLVLASPFAWIDRPFLFKKARAIRLEQEKDISNVMVSWIFLRLKALLNQKLEQTWLDTLRYILINTTIYDVDSLTRLPNITHPLLVSDALITSMNYHYDNALIASKTLDSDTENGEIEIIVTTFKRLLMSHLSPKYLSNLFELLTKLRTRYLTKELASAWHHDLEKQTKLPKKVALPLQTNELADSFSLFSSSTINDEGVNDPMTSSEYRP